MLDRDILYFPCEIVALISRLFIWLRENNRLVTVLRDFFAILSLYISDSNYVRYFGIVSFMSRQKQQPTRQSYVRQLQYVLDEGEGSRILDDRCNRISSHGVSWGALSIINLFHIVIMCFRA